MKIKITALSNNVYQFADKTISDNSTGTWRGRIINAPDISRSFSDLGSVASTLYIQLINYDLQIPLTEDLWNASIDVETDNGYKWSGKVSAYETNADGKLYITATETTAPEYSRYIPDEFARLVSIDEDVHMSALNVTIPTVIGGNADNPIPVKGILKSKSDAIYYLCIGEIHDIVKVRVGDKTMTRAEAAEQGYICYTGSANQTNESGIAYIQITDTSKRLNDDGSYVDIGAEVIGLKLGNHTVEECRNGARFLYWLLKTASSGVCGWGLGISTNDIDTASFETAITYVDLIGLKLDGVLYDNRSAQNWIDEICRAIRGTYEIGTDGKRRLAIDIASTSSYTYTKDNIELVRLGAGSFTGRVYNKGTLDYSYNPITGMFMQTSQYQNSESIARIDEQLFEGESYLIRDAETAQKIVEYTCKKSLVEANKILFNTRFLPENCRIGTVITINYPEKGMNNSLFKITSLQIGDHINRIEAVRYDTSIYESGSATATVAWQNEEPILSSVSVVSASGLSLNSGFDILPDGTGIASITGSFTMPNGSYITAIVEYGETASPSTWLALGLLKTGSFKISPVKVNTVYSVRIRLVTSTGHSDYVTGIINTVGDNTPPGAPTIAVSTYLKTTRIKVALNNPPPDLAGFEIWRSTMEGDEGTKIGYIAATNGSGTFVDIDVSDYLTNVYYSAVSVDLWGNRSDFSAQIIANCAKISVQDVIADWIMANTFETARGVGELVDGVKFNADGIQGWKNNLNVFNLNANGDSTIGGWIIGANRLYNSNISINSNGTIQTIDYASDMKGWSINQNGDAEFNNAKIRGAIKSAVFEKDNISVVGGYQLIRPATVISIKNETEGSYDIYVEDNSEFAVNDIVRMKLVTDNGAEDVWATVTAKGVNNDNMDYLTLDLKSGTWFVPEAGQTIVNYGPGGSGGILMDGNAPKMDLYTHSGTPWNGLNCQVRIGNLNGINGITTNKYGFFAGAANGEYIQWDGTDLNIKGKVIITSGSTYDAILAAQSSADTANNKIDTLSVGGRNLLRSTSSTEVSFTGTTKNYTLSAFAKSVVGASDTLTISFEAKASASRWIDFYFYASSTYASTSYFFPAAQLTTSYKKFVVTGVSGIALADLTGLRCRQSSSKHGSAATGATIYIKNLKLELGNRATSWTTAPEDIDVRLTYIDGNGIYTGTLTANQIDVNILNAISLNAPPFKASGTNHSSGIVPDPGATAGTTKFLCENATWKIPTIIHSTNTAMLSAMDITGAKAYSMQLLSYIKGGLTGLFSTSNNANAILRINKYQTDGQYNSELGFSSNGNLYYRNFANAVPDTTTEWKQIAFTSSNISGNAATATTAENVTGTVAIANGGTGATSRLNALKALTNENVGANATYFLTITDSWGKGGYTSVANAKSVLGIPQLVPVGTILVWCGYSSTIPTGFLLCNGSAVSRTTYATLYGVIGVAYGKGDGSTTFNLPNSASYPGLFYNGTISNSDKNAYFAQQLPNITGSGLTVCEAATQSGAIVKKTSSRIAPAGSTGYGLLIDSEFDASQSSSVYTASGVVRPASLKVKYIIKY